MAPVEDDVCRVLAAEHRIGLGPRRDEDRARRQHDLLRAPDPARPRAGSAAIAAAWPKRSTSTVDRRQQFGKADPLLHRLCHLLVIEGVARRVDKSPAIGDRHPAPAVEQLHQARRPALARGRSRARRGWREPWAMNSEATSCSARHSIPRAPPPHRARRPVSRSATETSRPGSGNRRATRSRCRSQSDRRRSRRPAAARSDWRCWRSWRRRSAAMPSGNPRPSAPLGRDRWASGSPSGGRHRRTTPHGRSPARRRGRS